MLETDIIAPCDDCEWASNVVLADKKGGEKRLYIDYKQLNEITKKDLWPIMRIDDALDSLFGAKFFTSLDMASGFWQIPLHLDSQEKTAFLTADGHYYFKVMPFGLCNAPSSFTRMMEKVLGDLKFKFVLIYIDDIIIYSSSLIEHLEHLRIVLDRFIEANLKLKPSKCFFCQKEVKFLGHIASEAGVRPDPPNVEAIQQIPAPKNIKQVRSFVGAATHYRKFIMNFSRIAAPLLELTRNYIPFDWSAERELAFQTLKCALSTVPVLAHFNPNARLRIETDGSGIAIGAVLSQESPTGYQVVSYASRTLNKCERNYPITEIEMLAIVWALDKFESYLGGPYEFQVITDHNAIAGLFKLPNPKGRLARWILSLRPYCMKISYRPGKGNEEADLLSRPKPELEILNNFIQASKGGTVSLPCFALLPKKAPSQDKKSKQQNDDFFLV